MSSVPLSIRGISKRYEAVQALKPLDLEVKPGEMLALLGPSGCGKTTTLRAIAGFEIPDTGSIHIGERDVTDLPPNRRDLGMVFQNYSLFPHMSVGENVAFGLKMRGVSRLDRDTKARAMLELVGLGTYAERQIHQLSGGQQQRVALARSLVTDPKVLLLDEPLGALDKNLRERMQFELREIQRRLGITSILVTHDQEEALTMSDRIAVMSAGEIVQIGGPTEVYERPKNRFVSEFLGTANIFEGIVLAAEDPRAIRVSLGAGAAEGLISAPAPLPAGLKVSFVVRPERLSLGAPEVGAVQARVRDWVFRGPYVAYELDCPTHDGPLVAYSQTRHALSKGTNVGLTWDADSAVLIEDRA